MSSDVARKIISEWNSEEEWEGGSLLFDAISGGRDEITIDEWTALHSIWLAVCCPVASRWLIGNGLIPKIDLREADLRGADLRGANLRIANLTGADLRGADLRGANLRIANLAGANLSRANLTGADLCRAGLTGADLSRANLTGASLQFADITSADLRHANLQDADLYNAMSCGRFLRLNGPALMSVLRTDKKVLHFAPPRNEEPCSCCKRFRDENNQTSENNQTTDHKR